jgi:predicted CXXCH cytochrome family protein
MKRAVVGPLVALAILFAGCSAVTRHRVLTIFFDGVPGPVAAREGGPSPVAAASSGRSAAVFAHGPYAARLCEACHARGDEPALPREQLCARCHDVRPTARVVHGPYADGSCRECHEPHSSPRRFLLVAEVGALCQRCHPRQTLVSVASHEPFDAHCTECHEPHASANDHLLR